MGSLAHEDEDTRPTSQKELAGWYAYGWAAEVFASEGPFPILVRY